MHGPVCHFVEGNDADSAFFACNGELAAGTKLGGMAGGYCKDWRVIADASGGGLDRREVDCVRFRAGLEWPGLVF